LLKTRTLGYCKKSIRRVKVSELNFDELSPTEQEMLKKIVENLNQQPTHRFAALAVTNPETGETKTIESRQTGDDPPKTKILKEKK
jgi:hypothetical protein